MTDENPFKEFPKISKLVKMLGKTTTTSDTIVRRWERSSIPPIPIKEIYIGNKPMKLITDLQKKKKV